MPASSWRALIQSTLAEMWPGLPSGQHWIEAQVHVESGGDPKAKSSHGAMGLMQLMPGTAEEVGVRDAFEPSQNLRGGVLYLRTQFEKLPEIPDEPERLLWAFAAYNGGRGYLNEAIRLARQDATYLDDSPEWWSWDTGRYWLMHRALSIRGLRPDYRQIWNYVSRIQSHFDSLVAV